MIFLQNLQKLILFCFPRLQLYVNSPGMQIKVIFSMVISENVFMWKLRRYGLNFGVKLVEIYIFFLNFHLMWFSLHFFNGIMPINTILIIPLKSRDKKFHDHIVHCYRIIKWISERIIIISTRPSHSKNYAP